MCDASLRGYQVVNRPSNACSEVLGGCRACTILCVMEARCGRISIPRASCMIRLESRERENRIPGTKSGARKHGCGSRTEARSESDEIATGS